VLAPRVVLTLAPAPRVQRRGRTSRPGGCDDGCDRPVFLSHPLSCPAEMGFHLPTVGVCGCPGGTTYDYGDSGNCECAAGHTSASDNSCEVCTEGNYKTSVGSVACTSCPTNAVSAEGSTSISSCGCTAGYTGDAASGGSCAACEAGTYKSVVGSVTCTSCPTHAVSAEGSTALSSCGCTAGYTGNSGSGGNCTVCGAGSTAVDVVAGGHQVCALLVRHGESRRSSLYLGFFRSFGS